MKINLNSNDLELFNNLIEQKNTNIYASELLNHYLDDEYNNISKEDVLNLASENGISDNSAFELLILSSLGFDEDDEEIVNLKNNSDFACCKKLNSVDYSNNFYYKNIKLDNAKIENFSIANDYYEPYEGFTFEDSKSKEIDNYTEREYIGYFDTKFNFPVLKESSKIWMSITPHEINTMKEAIDKCKGKVITYGLGLGYFPYMVSLKEDVEKVVIVEKNSKVINLFNKFILPQFEHKEKIEVIKADAFNHFKTNLKSSDFDYCFIDIYHDAKDALDFYFRFKSLESNNNIKYYYWIEDSILKYLRRYVLTILEEYFVGYTLNDYLDESTTENKIFKLVYSVIKDVNLNSFKDILNFISDSNLKEIAKKTYQQ